MEDRSISFSRRGGKVRRIFLPHLEIDASKLVYLSTQLVDWLPNDCERMLWLRNWHTYPPDQVILFETVRRGCEETRSIIDAPGHLFQSSAYDRQDYESRTNYDHKENATMWGLLLLMILLNWDGYLFAANRDYVELFDNALAISGTDDTTIKAAYVLADRFKLQFREQDMK